VRGHCVNISKERVAMSYVQKYKQPKGNRCTTLHLAAMAPCDNSHAIRALVETQGEDVDARDTNGQTPLHLAVITPGGAANVEQLLKLGADVEAVDMRRRTPYYLACIMWIASRDDSVIKLLKEHGAENTADDGPWMANMYLNCHYMLDTKDLEWLLNRKYMRPLVKVDYDCADSPADLRVGVLRREEDTHVEHLVVFKIEPTSAPACLP
jgi:Ankyrin repeats (3 copies)